MKMFDTHELVQFYLKYIKFSLLFFKLNGNIINPLSHTNFKYNNLIATLKYYNKNLVKNMGAVS